MSYVLPVKRSREALASGFVFKVSLLLLLVLCLFFSPTSFNISLSFYFFVGPARNECLSLWPAKTRKKRLKKSINDSR